MRALLVALVNRLRDTRPTRAVNHRRKADFYRRVRP